MEELVAELGAAFFCPELLSSLASVLSTWRIGLAFLSRQARHLHGCFEGGGELPEERERSGSRAVKRVYWPVYHCASRDTVRFLIMSMDVIFRTPVHF